MSKQKKKRNKSYTGSGATQARPAVTRIAAVNRSKASQWWYDHKRTVRMIAIPVAILFALIVMIIGLVGLLV
jgi:hypothetical protein